MKLWHDDIRRPPDDSWLWSRTNREAILALRTRDIEECSLDHDMGLHDWDPDEQDADLRVAYDAANQPDGVELVEAMIAAGLVPEKVRIHSFNYDGAKRMQAKLEDAGFTGVEVRPFDPTERQR